MLANDLSLSIRNPILIYSFLALYGLLTVLILTYVHAKFKVASKTLKLLQTEWTSAESKHANIVDIAQEHLSLELIAPFHENDVTNLGSLDELPRTFRNSRSAHDFRQIE